MHIYLYVFVCVSINVYIELSLTLPVFYNDFHIQFGRWTKVRLDGASAPKGIMAYTSIYRMTFNIGVHIALMPNNMSPL